MSISINVNVAIPIQNGALPNSYSTTGLDVGEIIINGVANAVALPSGSIFVDIEKEIVIEINKTGYFSFNQTLNLYENLDIVTVILVPNAQDTNNPFYNTPYNFSKTVQDPCSFDLINYNLSSFPGERTVYLNGVNVGTGNVVSIPNLIEADVQIGEKGITYSAEGLVRYANYSLMGVNAEYLSNVFISGYPPYSPTTSDDDYFNNNATTNVSITQPITFPLQYEIKECYEKDEVVTLTIPVQGDYGGTITILKDGGATLLDDTFDTSVEYTVDLPLNELGLYNITVAIAAPCPWLEKVTLEVCKSYILDGSCGDYTFSNISSKPLEVVTYLNNTNPATLESTVTVQPEGSISLTLELGVTSIQISTIENTETTVEEVIPFYNFCELEDCMASIIENTMCEDLGCNCDYDVSTELKAMRNIMLNYALFSKIDVMEDFYKNLTESLSYDLFSIQQIIDKIKEYCDRAKCVECNECSK
jgi:hypothetical protein